VELDSYGGNMMENRGALLLQILTKFSNDYCDTIDGKNNEAVSVNELMGSFVFFLFMIYLVY
jgi:1,4-dihydroxy-2-naphthoate octaprenyltransferase